MRGVARGTRIRARRRPSLTRVLAHEVGVGDAVGAADLEEPALLELEVESGKQVCEDILDGDRLRA